MKNLPSAVYLFMKNLPSAVYLVMKNLPSAVYLVMKNLPSAVYLVMITRRRVISLILSLYRLQVDKSQTTNPSHYMTCCMIELLWAERKPPVFPA